MTLVVIRFHNLVFFCLPDACAFHGVQHALYCLFIGPVNTYVPLTVCTCVYVTVCTCVYVTVCTCVYVTVCTCVYVIVRVLNLLLFRNQNILLSTTWVEANPFATKTKSGRSQKIMYYTIVLLWGICLLLHKNNIRVHILLHECENVYMCVRTCTCV